MFLMEQFDCPFSCCCFWPCYCCHHCNLQTYVGSRKELVYTWEEIEAKAQTGDFFSISTAGHWMFGPVCMPCQSRPALFSHVGIVYKKHDGYKTDLCQEFVEKIEANPTQTLFCFEAVQEGFTLNPLRPKAASLTGRLLTGWIVISPLDAPTRERLDTKKLYEAANELSEGIYDFNPLHGICTTIDVWPICGWPCPDQLCAQKAGDSSKGVCTTFCSRLMMKAGYFDRHDNETNVEKKLKDMYEGQPAEEWQANDILAQVYLFDDDEKMLFGGHTAVPADDEDITAQSA